MHDMSTVGSAIVTHGMSTVESAVVMHDMSIVGSAVGLNLAHDWPQLVMDRDLWRGVGRSCLDESFTHFQLAQISHLLICI